MIRVHRKILSKDKEGRMEERYTIFNNSVFRKRIKYLFIGLNPSASNNEFTDRTNLWIINWILSKKGTDEESGGYYLTNLYKDINPDSGGAHIRNDCSDKVIKRHAHLKIILFYGKTPVSKKKVCFNEKSVEILKAAFHDGRLYMTTSKGKFCHISCPGSEKKKIELCSDLVSVGIK